MTYKQFIKTKERFPMVAVVGSGPVRLIEYW